MVEHKNENLKETVLVSRKLKTNYIQKFYLHLSMASVRLCHLKCLLSLIVSKKHTDSSIYFFTGTASGWPYLLLINAGPALISLFLLPFVADSPRFLMIIKKDRINAEKGTQAFHFSDYSLINGKVDLSKVNLFVTVKGLFKSNVSVWDPFSSIIASATVSE